MAYNPLPANLRRGINIPWVFGNAEYLHAWNLITYSDARLNALFTQADFNSILNSNSSAPYFDHVRIPIDPTCFKAGLDGVVQSSDPEVALRIQALRNTINEAFSATPQYFGQSPLAVILAFHPAAMTEFQWINDYDRVISTTLTPPPNRPTSYKLQYVTQDPPLTGVPATHPLVRFWETLTPHLADFDKSRLYLAICDEPMISFQKGKMFPANQSPYTDLQLQQHRRNWRNIQLKVIEKLRSHSDERVHDFWLMANTYTAQPNDIDGWEGVVGGYVTGDKLDWMVPPNEVTPYTSTEVPNGRVIYSFSFYYPFRYTFWDWASDLTNPSYPDDPHYDNMVHNPLAYPDMLRDFKGVQNNAFPFPPSEPPEVNSANPLFGFDRCMKQMLTELAEFQTVEEDFGGGMSAETWLPIYIAGFGSKLRQGTIQIPLDGPIDQYMFGGNNFSDIYRRHWYYDTRRAFEAKGFGWAAWALFDGGFQSWTGQLSQSNVVTSPDIALHGNWGSIEPHVQQSLFSATRP